MSDRSYLKQKKYIDLPYARFKPCAQFKKFPGLKQHHAGGKCNLTPRGLKRADISKSFSWCVCVFTLNK